MNDTQEPSPPVEKPAVLVRAFLIILPIGLAFMVPLSLWIYYQKKYQPAPATSEYAAILQRDLNEEDFSRYARVLSQEIGERNLAKPDNLAAAAAYVESTMGYDNMGYAVQRQAFETKGRPVVNLIAELPGKSMPKEVVMVFANYDEADAAGISAVMCVAHALAGSEHARTIRFAAVVAGADGLADLRRTISDDGKTPRSLIFVTSAAEIHAGKLPITEDLRHFQLMPAEDSSASLEHLRQLQKLVEQQADAP